MQVLLQLHCPLLHHRRWEVFLDRGNGDGDKHGRLWGSLRLSFLGVALETLCPPHKVPVATLQTIPIPLPLLWSIWILRLPLAGCEKGSLYCVGIHSRRHQSVSLPLLRLVVALILVAVIVVHQYFLLVHTTPFHGLQFRK